MKENFGTMPEWLTFDCCGTLVQWDEGLDEYEATLGRFPGVTSPTEVSIAESCY
jgi:hypothetical protein